MFNNAQIAFFSINLLENSQIFRIVRTHLSKHATISQHSINSVINETQTNEMHENANFLYFQNIEILVSNNYLRDTYVEF